MGCTSTTTSIRTASATRRRREIPFPDGRTWRAYRRGGGTLTRDDWRRRNVDLLVEQLYKAVKEEKPWVKFGISPFGIWRPGSPPSVRGLDAYTEIYADSRKWLQRGWVDYFTPQLYWRSTRAAAALRRAAALVDGAERVRPPHLGRELHEPGDGRGANWPASELLEQVRLTRADSGASGNVHFSMTVFMQNRDSLCDRAHRRPVRDAGARAGVAVARQDALRTRRARRPAWTRCRAGRR